jgi:hypothetical protein
MLYDSGYHGGPRPGAPPMKPRYQQPQANHRQALAVRANQARQGMGISQPFEFPNYDTGPQARTAYSPQQPAMYDPQPSPYGTMNGVPGSQPGMAGGYRRRRRMYDPNGRLPGQWDYRPSPQYNLPPMQLY